jgi:uncharacterized protein YqeY
MSLFVEIKAARMKAFKEKDSIAKDILGVLLAESSKAVKEPADEQVIQALKKLIESNADTIKLMIQQDTYSAEEVIKLELQVDALKIFLPKQLSEDAMKQAVKYARTLGHDNLGAIMRWMKENYNGRYDGTILSRLVKEELTNE